MPFVRDYEQFGGIVVGKLLQRLKFLIGFTDTLDHTDTILLNTCTNEFFFDDARYSRSVFEKCVPRGNDFCRGMLSCHICCCCNSKCRVGWPDKITWTASLFGMPRIASVLNLS